MSEQDVRSLFASFSEEDMLRLLGDLVRLESPSRDTEALNALAHLLADRLGRAGALVEIIANQAGGDHVLARLPGTEARRPALVLGHFDTVWPRGTLSRLPFRMDADGRAFGPGIFDMKAGLVLILVVIEALARSRVELPRPIWVLLTSDEEIGSPTARAHIERLAADCAYVLVLEPPLSDGSLKTERKGVGRYWIEAEGRAAHAGAAPEEGRSAIVELAHQILHLQEVQDPAAGTTINVGVIDGGTTANVVPARAAAEIDVRVASERERRRVSAVFDSLGPITGGVRVTTRGGFTRPPMERTPAIGALFEEARRIAPICSLELTEGRTGGGSDGNFTAALGIPTLDGLGVLGGGAHADDEHILVASLPVRASLLLALLMLLRVQ
jgi:glutamate carboxypeptidase